MLQTWGEILNLGESNFNIPFCSYYICSRSYEQRAYILFGFCPLKGYLQSLENATILSNIIKLK